MINYTMSIIENGKIKNNGLSSMRKFEAFETRRHALQECFHFTYGTLINPHGKLSPLKFKKKMPTSLFHFVTTKIS